MSNILREISYSLHHSFGVNLWITVFLLLLTFVTIVFMLIYCLILFLDGTYRPNTPQYPYNIILDRVIPVIACFSPAIIVLYLDPESTTSLQKFGYIILIHCFILIPIMFYWSKHRNWGLTGNNLSYKLWNNPKLYLDIVLIIIYPAFWGCYLHILRYIRLGNELDILKYINYISLDIIVVLLFMWPFVILWLRLIITVLINLKKFLWAELINFTVSITLILLRYKIIFIILEKIYQISFIWVTFVICDPHIYKNKSYLRRKIHLLYLKPNIFLIIMFSIIIIELFYNNGKLWLSVYLITFFVILRGIIQFLNSFNGPTNNWVELCCYSNYINNIWINAYYQKKFWLSFKDMRTNLDEFPKLNVQEINKINDIINTWTIKDDRTRNRNYYIFMRLVNKPQTTLIHRMRLTYYKWTKIV